MSQTERKIEVWTQKVVLRSALDARKSSTYAKTTDNRLPVMAIATMAFIFLY